MLLTKEDFCYYLDRLRIAWDTDRKINNLLIDNCSVGQSDLSFLTGDVCELLARLIVDGVNSYDWACYLIWDFCSMGNFGRSCFSIEGVKIGSAEELYDFLVTNAVERGD